MRRLCGISLALLLLLCLPAVGRPAAAPKLPALYEFGAGHCYACKEMAKVLAELQASHGDQVEIRLVYADKEMDLFRQYKVMMIPTQVFIDAQGKEVDRHMGALTKDEVLQKLRQLQFIREKGK